MLLRPLFATLASVFLLQATAAAQPSPAPPTTVDEVVVPAAPALSEQSHRFVGGLVRRAPYHSLLRWQAPICPLVAGLPKEQAEYVLARVSDVVREVGAPLGKRDCRPNLYVVVSHEPERLLELWREKDRHLFGAGAPATVARFIATDRPVRVWHSWGLGPPDGRPPSEIEGGYGRPTLRFSKASRLAENAVRIPSTAIVVVDAGRLDGKTVTQLADYVAMASLTELRTAPRLTDAPTILSLFEEDFEPPAGLSPWDRAFLAGLYSTATESVTQGSAIATQMVKSLSAEAAASPAVEKILKDVE